MENPKRWIKEPLGKHAEVIAGKPFDSKGYTEEGINICGGLIIMPDRIAWEDCKHWPTSKGLEQFLLAKDDIVLAMDRPWIAEGFKIAKIKESELPALLIQRTARIRGVDLDQDFLMCMIKQPQFEVHCNITATTVPHISMKDISEYPVLVPPMELQKQFAEFVQQSDKSKFARLKSQFIEMFGDPVTNTKELPIANLPELGENLDNKRVPITGGDRKAGKYPYYGASGIVDYVADYIFDDDLLLISEDGANLIARVTPIAFPSTGKVWINNHAHVIKFKSLAMQCYVENLLNMIDISPYVTGTAQPKLNQAKLNTIPIPIPEETQIREYLDFVRQSDKSKLCFWPCDTAALHRVHL